MSARGSRRSFIARRASACIRAHPLVDTITGSTTIWRGLYVSSALMTASSVSASFTIPIFTASGRMSSITAEIWSYTASGGRGCTYFTPTVFCTVTAVTAEAPYTPRAEKVFRSAWIPAPPEGSEPAIVNADMYLFAAIARYLKDGACTEGCDVQDERMSLKIPASALSVLVQSVSSQPTAAIDRPAPPF